MSLSISGRAAIRASAGFLFVSPLLAQGMSPEVQPLDHRPADVEYSETLERIVTVAATPTSALHIIDPILGDTVTVDLGLVPNTVGVSPDGLTAGVGHDGWISYVDLATAAVIDTFPVTCDVFDIVVPGNGFAYCFPRFNQWESIRCIELGTGTETTSGGFSIRAGTVAKGHPSGTKMYGADNGLSPSDIERYNITSGTAQVAYDSPYHGDFAMCGDLWISEDGFRIFTRCTNVFRASDIQSEDMTYNGSLPTITRVESLDHSMESSKIVAIEELPSFSGAGDDRFLHVFDDAFFAYEGATPLPTVDVGGSTFDLRGRWVMLNADGTRAFIVGQVDPSSGLLLDHGIATYSFGGPCTGSWSTIRCAATANSSGAPAELSFAGSLSVDGADTAMVVDGAPADSFGLFFFGASAGTMPAGDGFLCIDIFSSGLHRPWPVVRASGAGSVSYSIDFGALSGADRIRAGSTHYFQFWYRDAGPGSSGFNYSTAVEAQFCD